MKDTRTVPVTHEFYAQLIQYLNPIERFIIVDRKDVTGLVLYSPNSTRLEFVVDIKKEVKS